MYIYDNPYGGTFGANDILSSTAESAVWAIVSVILAFVGAFLVYFLFVKNSKKFDNKFLTWLREFVDFQKMLIEPILKISYIFFALLITLESFALISTSFIEFLLVLVFGNVIVRVVYEIAMITVGIWKNTQEINKKMK